MARVLIATQAWGVLQGREGDTRSGVSVQLNDLAGAVADVFTSEDGSDAQTLVSNARGEIPGWVETGSYDLTVSGITRRVEATSGSVEGTGLGLLRYLPSQQAFEQMLTPLAEGDVDTPVSVAIVAASGATNFSSITNPVGYAASASNTDTRYATAVKDPSYFKMRGVVAQEDIGGGMIGARFYGSNASGAGGTFEFLTDADVIDFHIGGRFPSNFLVNGRLVSPTALNLSAGGVYFVRVTFADAQMRHITLLGPRTLFGVAINRSYGIYPPTVPPSPRLAYMGDSFTETEVAEGGFDLPSFFAARLGWYDLVGSGIGGTGYLNNGVLYTPFEGVRSAELVALNPDVFLVMGGLNDGSGSGAPAVLQAAAESLFADFRAANADAPIVAVGPWVPSASHYADSDRVARKDAIKAALATVDGPWLFIDNYTGGWVTDRASRAGGGPWLTGTGKAGATTGIGNADRFVNTDGTHPSPVAVRAYCRRMAEAFIEAFQDDERVA